MTTDEARAYNAITCADPNCPDKGTVLVAMAVTEDGTPIELEFCSSHARQRTYLTSSHDEVMILS